MMNALFGSKKNQPPPKPAPLTPKQQKDLMKEKKRAMDRSLKKQMREMDSANRSTFTIDIHGS